MKSLGTAPESPGDLPLEAEEEEEAATDHHPRDDREALLEAETDRGRGVPFQTAHEALAFPAPTVMSHRDTRPEAGRRAGEEEVVWAVRQTTSFGASALESARVLREDVIEAGQSHGDHLRAVAFRGEAQRDAWSQVETGMSVRGLPVGTGIASVNSNPTDSVSAKGTVAVIG